MLVFVVVGCSKYECILEGVVVVVAAILGVCGITSGICGDATSLSFVSSLDNLL